MYILNIKNMGDLVPNYPDYWMVAVEHQPDFTYTGRQTPRHTQAWL